MKNLTWAHYLIISVVVFTLVIWGYIGTIVLDGAPAIAPNTPIATADGGVADGGLDVDPVTGEPRGHFAIGWNCTGFRPTGGTALLGDWLILVPVLGLVAWKAIPRR